MSKPLYDLVKAVVDYLDVFRDDSVTFSGPDNRWLVFSGEGEYSILVIYGKYDSRLNYDSINGIIYPDGMVDPIVEEERKQDIADIYWSKKVTLDYNSCKWRIRPDDLQEMIEKRRTLDTVIQTLSAE